jgi:hypothetical protein
VSRLVVDASVAIKWLVVETLTDDAVASLLFREHVRGL